MSVGRFIFFCVALIFSALANAATPDSNISFERRSWSPIEGAPSGAWAITQSADGLLWIATPGGLYRFDGERFHKVDKIYGHELLSTNIHFVLSTRQGIAVLYQFGGLSIFAPDRVRHYGVADGLPSGKLGAFVQAPDGKLYVGTGAGLAVLNLDRWELLRESGLPQGRVDRILFDHDDTFWIVIDAVLYGRAKGSRTFSKFMPLDQTMVPDLVLGKLLATDSSGKPVQVQYGKEAVTVMDGLPTNTSSIFEGPLSTEWAWLGNRGGLVRLRRQDNGRYTVAESFEAGRLSKSIVLSSFIDREGNAWLGTTNGIERIRGQRVHEISIPDEIFAPYVHLGLDDSVLISGILAKKVLRVTDSGHVNQLDLANIQSMWRENSNSLWAGSPAGLFHITHQGVINWGKPNDVGPSQVIQAITVDTAGVVWVSISRAGLYRFSAGRWAHVDANAIDGYTVPISALASKSGGVWLGYANNRIGQVVNGQVRRVPTDQKNDIGTVLSLLEFDGHIIAGGEKGLAWLDKNGSKAILPDQIDAFRGVAGLALDKQGSLWVHGTEGIYRVAKDELIKAQSNSNYRLKWELFSLADGVRGTPAQIRPLPSLTVANDGRIFYATNSQVGWIDPLNVRRNARIPDVLVLGLRVGDKEIEPKGQVILEAGTNAIDIKYAVTALSVPEKVQAKYRLSGVDHGWQVATGERIARYTNLDPGSYTFQVSGANEDGVWNKEGAILKFEILPNFWQTVWFRLLILFLLVTAIIAFHRWRIAMAAARAAERMATRDEERERIARSLHDNLLQGVHALILRSSIVLNRLPKGSQEEQILENVLGQAEKLVEETRDEVMALRDSQSASQTVAELRAELKAMEADLTGRLQFVVSEDVGRIRPDVARAVCQVLKEAVTNAARHSMATKICATLTVSTNGIEGTVLDNGIGIAPDIAQTGISGHWGIVGMRERMSKLGGTLTIESNGGTGTALRFKLASGFSFN